ncbi:Transglycosylase SLT domain-containing protein [Streptomyces sp. DvalAA-14]|uniref:LysM peptidoglycan-binding domain-containing protein n=1 Tax=unclassified Streptomyces TaxID=2593676 RepID=UPI00081B26A2|nr:MULTISPECIES: LysM peptidoglycan-binding domain-containing protein [unclassified Streptomyces]MYS21076.1 LysM peptidoglycan-binding domain-containing protein [Streptomyces sp. SID4948]SCD83617.1 Transglycosylase SLT domain-containing protein [Streptomyces sp. DvalAA-14]
MPNHALNRSVRTRLFSARGAVVVGTFALGCAVVTGTAQAASAPPAAPATTGTTPQPARTTTYVVNAGDYLVAIARSQHVPGGWQAIASANGITSPYVIQPGQRLKLPAGSAGSTGSTAKAATASTHASSTTGVVPATTAASTASTASKASTASGPTYTDDLDGWIKHSLAIMAQNGIPGSYDGIYRNTMRESSGNPNAINLWDSNAAAGTPSIGLLQVIQPTFDAYHVPGTSTNIYDPVANLTAACNYAYHVYGSIDNVNGPY